MEQIKIKVSISVDQGVDWNNKSFGSASMETVAQLSSIDQASDEMRRLVLRVQEEVERQIGITKQVKALEEQKKVRAEIGTGEPT